MVTFTQLVFDPAPSSPWVPAICRCGQRLDSRGRSARVSQNIRVQDLDLLPVPRWTTVVWKWWQTASSFSKALSWPSTPQWSMLSEQMVLQERQCAGRDGVPDQARRTKNFGFQSSLATRVGPCLVDLACESGGRWSEEAHDFLRQFGDGQERVGP